MEALVVLFDALIKFKCISVPHTLADSFDEYCKKRNIIIHGGAVGYKCEYYYFYTESI